MIRTGSGTLVRQLNRAAVLTLVQSRGPISQAEIVTVTGLGKATVSAIVAELATDGWLVGVGAAAAAGDRGGRPSTLLRLDPLRGYVVGVKILETAITVVITDLDARVVYHDTTSIPEDVGTLTPSAAAEGVLSVTAQRIEAVIAMAGVDRDRVLGVGVGLTGLVDHGVGFLSRLFPDGHDFQVTCPLQERLGLPVYAENDVNTLAVAEQWFGVGKGCSNFVVVTIGRGIGAGLIVHDQLVRGVRGAAGELGHLRVDADGPVCECGGRGCLQAAAADPAVIGRVAQELAQGTDSVLDADDLSIATIGRAADHGDELARRVLASSGAMFGRAVAGLINIVAPEKVILSGEGIDAGPWRTRPMLEAIKDGVLPQIVDTVDICIEHLEFESWARGAACAVLGRLFDSPLNGEEGDSRCHTTPGGTPSSAPPSSRSPR